MKALPFGKGSARRKDPTKRPDCNGLQPYPAGLIEGSLSIEVQPAIAFAFAVTIFGLARDH